MGVALMGTGSASGDQRALLAARQAVESPLLEDVAIDGATGILINITGGGNMTLMEVNQACSLIQEAAHEDANIIFGSVIDDAMGDVLKITVIATGFAGRDSRRIERIDNPRTTMRSSIHETSRTEPGPARYALNTPAPARTPEVTMQRQTPAPSTGLPMAGLQRVTPAPQPKPSNERPTRHLSMEELRKMTGIDEDELDIPTFMRHNE
ncbi:MAG: cell division protein FtsZ, partial [Deltaproteobacteria bacterium]|nr:cell division protein FtsZ [Deltaproteobacteria bacterium]